MKLGSLALAAASLFPIAAHATDALAAPRQRMQAADYRATGHLVRVDENGLRTSYAIAIKAHWFPGVLRVLLEIAPTQKMTTDARAHVLLEMRPKGQNSIRIAHPGDAAPAILPFGKWSDGPLGAGFSYEDFLEPEYFWPGQIALEEAKFGARDCDVVKSTPGADDKTHYAEVRTWLDHGIGFPVYAEKTLKATGVVKEFTSFGLRQESGVWSASQVEAKTRGHAGSTRLIIDRGSVKAGLGRADFSSEKLTVFQDR